MIKKSPLIKAMMKVVSEYNDNSHRLNMSTCPMCVLYRDNDAYDCGRCPMRQAFKACGRRQCEPVHCYKDNDKKRIGKAHMKQLEAVKEFYYKVIARTRRMTVKELNEPGAFRFMVEIDQSTGKKYGIQKEVGPWNDYV